MDGASCREPISARPCGRQNWLEKMRTVCSDGGLLRCYRPKGAFGEESRLEQEAEAFDLQSVNGPPLPDSRTECAPCAARVVSGAPKGGSQQMQRVAENLKEDWREGGKEAAP
ncbi:hypothetical protein J1605_008617 [Eschrichtius robustus]|uniref:Uncharacterized protein n=1 Tax=Eschrichtius robustus TaxID=9764 RepID=A0AB34GYT8_ESCRO|nr:hypothetical protein J1605_008617 [Eschrichtius robustus]